MPNRNSTPTGNKPIESLGIRIEGSSITIIDYSQNEDSHQLVAFIEAMGFKTNVKSDSWCG